jgi:flagellar biogenesis protein FliO
MAEVMRTLSIFALLLISAASLWLIARRLLPLCGQSQRPESPLRHLGTLPLTPPCSVALVRAGQETLVLGLTSQSVTLLTKINWEKGGAGLRLGSDTERARSSGATESRAEKRSDSGTFCVPPLA